MSCTIARPGPPDREPYNEENRIPAASPGRNFNSAHEVHTTHVRVWVLSISCGAHPYEGVGAESDMSRECQETQQQGIKLPIMMPSDAATDRILAAGVLHHGVVAQR